jgi:hypothetical protein
MSIASAEYKSASRTSSRPTVAQRKTMESFRKANKQEDKAREKAIRKSAGVSIKDVKKVPGFLRVLSDYAAGWDAVTTGNGLISTELMSDGALRIRFSSKVTDARIEKLGSSAKKAGFAVGKVDTDKGCIIFDSLATRLKTRKK